MTQGTQVQQQRVLPADVYDTLALTAHAFGGIGAGKYFEWEGSGTPRCVIGHAWRAEGPGCDEVSRALREAGIREGANDVAVWAINERKGKPFRERNDRVSFEEWCAALNVVRGDA